MLMAADKEQGDGSTPFSSVDRKGFWMAVSAAFAAGVGVPTACEAKSYSQNAANLERINAGDFSGTMEQDLVTTMLWSFWFRVSHTNIFILYRRRRLQQQSNHRRRQKATSHDRMQDTDCTRRGCPSHFETKKFGRERMQHHGDGWRYRIHVASSP
jgi:hypothetical protein